MIIRNIVFSTNPPITPYVLWVKAGANNINTIHIYDGGWKEIGTSSGGGTLDYTDLENKPKINNIVLDGNLSLADLGIIIPSLENYVTKEALNAALSDYAKKADIPSVEGLLSEIKAQELYQPKGDYALKSELPDTTDLATKAEVTEAISNQEFKTINGQEITGEGNIEIQGGGSSITVDAALNEESINPVQNKVITQNINQINSELEQKQPKGDYALRTEIPDTSDFITEAQVDTKLEGYAPKSDIPDVSDLASKEEVSTAISSQQFKTVNGQEITGEGNIEIQGGSTVTVDDALNAESVNPVQNKVITEKINAMDALLAQLDEKVFPTTLSVSGGGTYDEGTTQVVTVTWKLQKNGQTLTPDSVTVNEEAVEPSVNYKVFTGVTTTTTYTVSVVYGGKTYTGKTTATFKKTYYRYYGGIPGSTSFGDVTSEMVKALKKEVCTGAGITLTYTNIDDQRMVNAYPKTFGELTQIKDGALNAPLDNWDIEAEMNIDGIVYYVYASREVNYEYTGQIIFVK